MLSSPAMMLSSCSSSFCGQSLVVPSPISTRVVFRNPRDGFRLSVRACSKITLVDKSEADKVNRLKTAYLEKIIPLLKEEFSYTNVHQVPKIEKIVVNCGIGEAAQNSKSLDVPVRDLTLITGQKPIKTKARTSVATFKLREGQPIGVAVTLRGKMMWSFLDRLINLGLPRTRDFQGTNPNSFDGHGNYSIGVKEQSVFPEIKFSASGGKARGMDVCITTTANTDKEAQRLLALMGMPFREGGGPTVLIRKKKKKAHHFDQKANRRR